MLRARVVQDVKVVRLQRLKELLKESFEKWEEVDKSVGRDIQQNG